MTPPPKPDKNPGAPCLDFETWVLPNPLENFLLHLQALCEILTVALFFVTFIAQPFRIPSASMEPTLKVGDFLLGNKQAFAPSGFLGRILPPTTIRRGEIVIFHYPIDPSRDFIKRIIGIPGDHLRLLNGQVLLNGSPLTEPYAVYTPSPHNNFRDDFPSLHHIDPDVDPTWWAQLLRTTVNHQITVPPNQYFVLGDNRNDSEDSRYWGYVPRNLIVARPLLVYFSLAVPPQQTRPKSPFRRFLTDLHTEFADIHILH